MTLDPFVAPSPMSAIGSAAVTPRVGAWIETIMPVDFGVALMCRSFLLRHCWKYTKTGQSKEKTFILILLFP